MSHDRDDNEDYADMYADDGDGGDDDDDDELAEMFAKVQNIQRAEGMDMKPMAATTGEGNVVVERLEVVIPERTTSTTRAQTPPSTASSLRSRSPANSIASGVVRSADGITTIVRKGEHGNVSHASDVLLGVKKPAFYQEKLLQTAKQQSQTLEQLKQKVVSAAPAKIAKRIETLSEPKKAETGRKFALDEEEKHCRFRTKKKKATSQSSDFDDDNGSGNDRSSDFIARMEAAERNRQKKLELTRGENEYQANLNKKVCPKCQIPQSYSEYRDKKKKCQICGSEFRVPQAWGDIGNEFINRIADDSKVREQRRQEIKTQVVREEVSKGRVVKTATQQFYESQLLQRHDQKSFLDRNYKPTSNLSNSKTILAQARLQQKIEEQRARLLASAKPTII